jgi:hypothetical protein
MSGLAKDAVDRRFVVGVVTECACPVVGCQDLLHLKFPKRKPLSIAYPANDTLSQERTLCLFNGHHPISSERISRFISNLL